MCYHSNSTHKQITSIISTGNSGSFHVIHWLNLYDSIIMIWFGLFSTISTISLIPLFYTLFPQNKGKFWMLLFFWRRVYASEPGTILPRSFNKITKALCQGQWPRGPRERAHQSCVSFAEECITDQSRLMVS